MTKTLLILTAALALGGCLKTNDQYCRDIGMQHGTSGYAQCRMIKDEQSMRQLNDGLDTMGRGLSNRRPAEIEVRVR